MNKKGIITTVRSKEWWEYKIPLFLAIGYATAIQHEKNLFLVSSWLLVLISSLVCGAVYVSLINDFTDLKDDVASGKHNRLQHKSRHHSTFLIIASAIIGLLFFILFFRNNPLSALCYLFSWISFSLYSIPPFRWKNRRLLGVFADACGAHLFPSLLIVISVSSYLNTELDVIWLSLIGIWSLMIGLRGILWHQFLDRKNDLSIGLNTYATSIETAFFKRPSQLITAVEVVALLAILIYLALPIPVLFLAIYFLLLWGYTSIMGLQVILIVPTEKPWHIFFWSYYQILLPLSLLLTSAIYYPVVLLILISHLILFPETTKQFTRDIVRISGLIYLKSAFSKRFR